MDKIKESQPSRIVVVSSLGHQWTVPGGIDFDTLNDPTVSTEDQRCGRSKLANILFGNALARRLASEKVYVNSTHPGCIETELTQSKLEEESGNGLTYKILRFLLDCVNMTPREACLTPLYLATSPEIVEQDIRGRYFIPIANEIQPTYFARDEELQEKLWKFSEELVKEKIGV